MNCRNIIFGAALLVCGLCLAPGQPLPDQVETILSRSALSGNTWSILVESQDGSTTFYSKNADTGLAPASNTKMFMTAAAFGLLGTDYAFQTRVYGEGTFANGNLNGNLNLVSEHDITWNTSVFSGNARAALNHIASRLKSLGLTNVTGMVQCYGLCAYGLGSTDYLTGKTTTGRNADAAAAFDAALKAQGITTSGVTAGQSGFSPPGNLLYTHRSSDMTYGGKPLRLDVACIPLMKVSHNVMADGLCRHIGWKLAGSDTYAGGAGQVLRWLRNTAGLNTNGIAMNDGSGLSHNNRFTARQHVALTRYMLAAFPTWETTLPISCTDGTISSRLCGTDTTGYVKAKTGSLSISIALSGLINNRHDGRRLLFSFVANRTSIAQSDTRLAIDDSVRLFASRGVPLSPPLALVSADPGSGVIRLEWYDEKFPRTAYRVYTSDDGHTFGPPVTLSPVTHTWADAGAAPGNARFYKVTVVGTGGESKASRIYGARLEQTLSPSRVLVVDGNDRWQFQTAENPFCTNHAFAAITARSISGAGFDTAHHRAVIDGTVRLTNYPAVVWLLGEESSVDETFDATEQALVADYLARGGNLFVSGSEVAWDLDRDSGPTAADRAFLRTHLRAALGGNANDDANTYAFAPAPGSLFAGNPASGFDNGTRGTYDVDYPDVLSPVNGGTAALTYVGGLGGAAAVQYSGTGNGGKVVFFGFPFETITNAPARDAYMSDVLRFFDVLDPPRMLAPEVLAGGSGISLSWTSSAGLNYRVDYKDALTDATWRALRSNVLATGTVTTVTDPAPTDRRFYRILLVD